MPCEKLYSLLDSILFSPNKVSHKVPQGTVRDYLQFGFSFVETEDHMVEYLVANPIKTKQIILACMEDFEIDPDDISIGRMWGAKIVVSKKLKDNQIIFSNINFSTVLNLYIFNPHAL